MYRRVMAPPSFVRMAAHPLRWSLLTELAGSDFRVRELTERLGQPQNLISYHLRLLRGSGLVTARRSSFDARDSYHHLDLDRCADALSTTGAALHPALAPWAATDDHVRRPAGPAPGAVRVHRQQRPLADRRGLVAPPQRGGRRRGDQCRQPPQAGHASPRGPRAARGVRPRHRRPAPTAPGALAGRRFDYVITLCDKVREVRPALRRRSPAGPLEHPRPAAPVDHDDYAAFARIATQIHTRVRHLTPVLGTTASPEVDRDRT